MFSGSAPVSANRFLIGQDIFGNASNIIGDADSNNGEGFYFSSRKMRGKVMPLVRRQSFFFFSELSIDNRNVGELRQNMFNSNKIAGDIGGGGEKMMMIGIGVGAAVLIGGAFLTGGRILGSYVTSGIGSGSDKLDERFSGDCVDEMNGSFDQCGDPPQEGEGTFAMLESQIESEDDMVHFVDIKNMSKENKEIIRAGWAIVLNNRDTLRWAHCVALGSYTRGDCVDNRFTASSVYEFGLPVLKWLYDPVVIIRAIKDSERPWGIESSWGWAAWTGIGATGAWANGTLAPWGYMAVVNDPGFYFKMWQARPWKSGVYENKIAAAVDVAITLVHEMQHVCGAGDDKGDCKNADLVERVYAWGLLKKYKILNQTYCFRYAFTNAVYPGRRDVRDDLFGTGTDIDNRQSNRADIIDGTIHHNFSDTYRDGSFCLGDVLE